MSGCFGPKVEPPSLPNAGDTTARHQIKRNQATGVVAAELHPLVGFGAEDANQTADDELDCSLKSAASELLEPALPTGKQRAHFVYV